MLECSSIPELVDLLQEFALGCGAIRKEVVIEGIYEFACAILDLCVPVTERSQALPKTTFINGKV